MRYVLSALFFFISATLISQTLPSITVDGNQEFCGETPMLIVTNVSITNADGTNAILDVVYIQISQGYTSVGFVGDLPEFDPQKSNEENFNDLIASESYLKNRFNDADFIFDPKKITGYSSADLGDLG